MGHRNLNEIEQILWVWSFSFDRCWNPETDRVLFFGFQLAERLAAKYSPVTGNSFHILIFIYPSPMSLYKVSSWSVEKSKHWLGLGLASWQSAAWCRFDYPTVGNHLWHIFWLISDFTIHIDTAIASIKSKMFSYFLRWSESMASKYMIISWTSFRNLTPPGYVLTLHMKMLSFLFLEFLIHKCFPCVQLHLFCIQC